MTIARYPVRDGMVAEMDDVAAVLFGRDGAWGNSVPAAAVLARAKEVMRERRGEHAEENSQPLPAKAGSLSPALSRRSPDGDGNGATAET